MSALEAVPGFDDVVAEEWASLAVPGTWWMGDERVAIAAQARSAREGEVGSDLLDELTNRVVARVSAEPASITGDVVRGWYGEGLHPYAYIELVGVVSRINAIDATEFGLGRERRGLPGSLPGVPSREVPEGAAMITGWAPTVGDAGAVSSLSAVAPEKAAMFALADTSYLSAEEMADHDITKDLHRTQIELIASRASRLNDCFY